MRQRRAWAAVPALLIICLVLLDLPSHSDGKKTKKKKQKQKQTQQPAAAAQPPSAPPFVDGLPPGCCWQRILVLPAAGSLVAPNGIPTRTATKGLPNKVIRS